MLHAHIERLLTRHPAVVVQGARQTGKTTLAKTFGGRYFDVEDLQDRQRLEIEWSALMHRKELIILDEIQAYPELLLRLGAVIDESRRMGRFLLLSSFASPLMKRLKRRTAVCELPPLIASECDEATWDELWKTGGYPQGALPDWHRTYLACMAQRDLPSWQFPGRPMITERLFHMLAALHGQPWNASQIGKSLGLSYHTINTYVEFLERAFLVRRLPAYLVPDTGKRLVRSPKLYWRDAGLLHTLLHYNPKHELYAQPWVGASWEGWVIEQVLAHFEATGQPCQAYHFHTSDDYGLDLVLRLRNQLWALHITITSMPDETDLKRLQKTAEMIGAGQAIQVSRTEKPVEYGETVSLNLKDTLERLLGG